MLSWLCIFRFEKCVTQSIKFPFENKAADPTSPELWSPFFLSLSLSLSFSLFSGWIPGAQRPSEFTFLPGLLRPDREGALRLHPTERAPEASVNRASPVSGALLAFCVNQGISASFSLLYFLIGWLQTTRFWSIKGPQHLIFSISLFSPSLLSFWQQGKSVWLVTL